MTLAEIRGAISEPTIGHWRTALMTLADISVNLGEHFWLNIGRSFEVLCNRFLAVMWKNPREDIRAPSCWPWRENWEYLNTKLGILAFNWWYLGSLNAFLLFKKPIFDQNYRGALGEPTIVHTWTFVVTLMNLFNVLWRKFQFSALSTGHFMLDL
jgi:hypothetical protein